MVSARQIEDYVPPHLLNERSIAEWERLIMEDWRTRRGIKATMAQVLYLERVRSVLHYGTMWFDPCKWYAAVRFSCAASPSQCCAALSLQRAVKMRRAWLG